jgi:hypothetical protein
MAFDRALPGDELFDRQLVATANFFEADNALAHCVDDYRFAPRDPTFCIRRRQVGRDFKMRQASVSCRVQGRYALSHDNNNRLPRAERA